MLTRKSTARLFTLNITIVGAGVLWINGPATGDTQESVTSPQVMTIRTQEVVTFRTQEVVTSPNGNRTSLLKPSSKYVVPNTVHYVWFGEGAPLKFHHYLSVLGAHQNIKPDRILWHTDSLPVGIWWQTLRNKVNNLEVIFRRPPLGIFTNWITRPEHQSDVARIQILQEYGGIYLDTDVIPLQSFDPLRRYSFTMGLEYHGDPGRLNNGVIISTRNAEFLSLWLAHYRDFNKGEWDLHDSIVPYEMMIQYPLLIHVEERTLNYPSGKELRMIYKENYDWSKNYAIHLWHSLYEVEHGVGDIQTLNCTFGEIARFVYFGNKTMHAH